MLIPCITNEISIFFLFRKGLSVNADKQPSRKMSHLVLNIFPKATSQVTISQVATSQMSNFPSGNFPNVQFPKRQLPEG